MVVHLAPLDWAIVAIFLVGIIALGLSVSAGKPTPLQFLAAGRRLTLPAFVATLVATWYGGILGVAESVAYFGIGAWVLIGVPYYAFAALYALWLAKRVRQAEEISIPERLAQAYGNKVAVIGAVLVFLLAVPAAHALMLGVLVQALTGWTAGIALVAACGAGCVFLLRGGLLADVRISLLSFLMMYVGFGVAVAYCALNFPLLEPLRGLQQPQLLAWDGGTGWAMVVSFFVLGAWTLVDPGFHQRAASAATPEISRKGVWTAVAFWMIFDLLSISAGLYSLVLVQPAPTDPLLLFPALGEAVLPQGLKAVFLCGLFGTIFTAFGGYALVAGASFGREIVGRLRPQKGGDVALSRIGIGIAVVIGAILASLIQSVVALWYAWAGAVVGALLIPLLQAYGIGPLRHLRPAAVGTAMTVSFLASVAWLAYGKTSGNGLLEAGFAHGKLVFPGSPAWEQATKFGVGTLMPGLLISAVILTIGELTSRRKAA